MDLEKAKLNPAAVFKTPQEIVSSQELSREQKIGPQLKLLQPIRDALHALDYWPDTEHSSPSKA